MKRILLAAALLASGPAIAAPIPTQAKPDPTQQALVQMLSEAQSREANALVQVWSLRAEVESLKAQVAAETKRADEAEAKLKPASEAAGEPAK